MSAAPSPRAALLSMALAVPLPDFTDCSFATREPDADWLAVTHQGGPVRAFAPEKAYPEDEAVFSSAIDVEGDGAVVSEIVYEQRFGARNQFEIVVPFAFREEEGGWTGGRLGDVALGVKRAFYHDFRRGTIFSLTGEFVLPTSDGGGPVVFEPFASFGQVLPADAFVQLQSGAELGVTALPLELEASALRNEALLQTDAARLAVEEARVAGGRLEAVVAVENLAGHKLPTGYPSQRVWLHVSVCDQRGAVVFESGALDPAGRIAGNDNDADGGRYEPHYAEITRPDQVQVYEAVMADPQDRVTTGLLTAVRFVKDNRILPRGIDKATAPGDRVRYVVDVAGHEGPFRVEAALWYQPIAYRWAQNLAGYDAPEPRRFVTAYAATADASALQLVTAATTVR